MKISIALAVYNGTNFLDQQLASFLKQTRLPDELVVVDDCSTDATVELLEDFAKTSPFPVKIFRNESNSGSTYSFGRAIEACSGDVVMLSDHDDIWVTEKVSRLTQLFVESDDIGLVFTNAELIGADGASLGRNKFTNEECREISDAIASHELIRLILKNNVVGGATCAFRAVYTDLLLPIPAASTLIHDAWIGLIIPSVAEVRFIPAPLIRYRQHSAQQIGRKVATGSKRKERITMTSEAVDRLSRRIIDMDIVKERLVEIEDRNSGSLKNEALSQISEARRFAGEATQHFETRSQLNQSRLRRIPAVVREYLTGRYQIHSNGLNSAIRDLWDN